MVHKYHSQAAPTPCVNIAGFPDSNISSNSSLVVVLPAVIKQEYRLQVRHYTQEQNFSMNLNNLPLKKDADFYFNKFKSSLSKNNLCQVCLEWKKSKM